MLPPFHPDRKPASPFSMVSPAEKLKRAAGDSLGAQTPPGRAPFHRSTPNEEPPLSKVSGVRRRAVRRLPRKMSWTGGLGPNGAWRDRRAGGASAQ